MWGGISKHGNLSPPRLRLLYCRLAETSATCPAAFRKGRDWITTSDSARVVHSCRTQPRPRATAAAHGGRNEIWGRDFFRGAHSLQEAVASYGSFHDAVTSAADLRDDVRYVVYRPSFHGEGWGNRAMALAAVAAFAMSSGRVLLIDWTSSWALEDYVSLPCRLTKLGLFRTGV